MDPWGLYRLQKGKDNTIYAIIELDKGDTLYGIAQSEVGDGNAWVNMNYPYDPGYLYDGELVDITGIYNENYPNPAHTAPYLSDNDYDSGVRLVRTEGNWYYDVSIAVNNAVWNDRENFSQHSMDIPWFIEQVGDTGAWNIKMKENWEQTIKTPFPEGQVLFFGEKMYIEQIGNITYGYLGKAAHIPELILFSGSIANNIKNHGVEIESLKNEFRDDVAIARGMAWYDNSQ